ncbi:MAG TPA: hypothetical protein DCL41_01640 [Bdellovibrionales bacterium]|nr:hypothetical protein [Pseudobdellovibrionaceae bacterium]HAG90541.1 hypothetical protein [Bdellovibrionales bacterium]|tara:strand:- start:7520 stop:7816 length:297 start_codon:yes stop_codon:yes gene_type:complete
MNFQIELLNDGIDLKKEHVHQIESLQKIFSRFCGECQIRVQLLKLGSRYEAWITGKAMGLPFSICHRGRDVGEILGNLSTRLKKVVVKKLRKYKQGIV